MTDKALTRGSRSSLVVERCQVCGCADLQEVLFLGYMPPVNQMRPIGQIPTEQPAYPALVLRCQRCGLVQLGLIVDPEILFPPEYPYASGTTKILRDDFADLYRECAEHLRLIPSDLVVDIGSNDGTLLSNFVAGGHRVVGVEPTQMGLVAQQRGIPTRIGFFDRHLVEAIIAGDGQATLITATNVFAHIEDVGSVVEAILMLLKDDGVFISESHYLMSLLETLQYDTVYHEHLRYYSLSSLDYLLGLHGLEAFHARRIPTHGGSIRVYAARTGRYRRLDSVERILEQERKTLTGALGSFAGRVVRSKWALWGLLREVKDAGARIYGVGAPSRASTLVNYVGISQGIVDCVVEVKGSQKIGKYMPGTRIPVVEESRLFEDQPEYALMLSWHIADELVPKLKAKGFAGRFIIPLPEPRVA